jgi:hypothetical protein
MKNVKSKVVFKDYNFNQNLLLPPSLEEMITPNHPVRVVNQVVDNLNLDPILKKYEGGGCPAYHPRLMLNVLVYPSGYFFIFTEERRIGLTQYVIYSNIGEIIVIKEGVFTLFEETQNLNFSVNLMWGVFHSKILNVFETFSIVLFYTHSIFFAIKCRIMRKYRKFLIHFKCYNE